MDELMAKLQAVLSTKEGQEQLKSLQNMFGGGSGAQPQAAPSSSAEWAQPQGTPPSSAEWAQPQAAPPSAEWAQPQGTPSSSAEWAQPQAPAPQSAPDFSALAGMLSGLMGGGQGASVSANQPQGAPNIDMNMILKLQQVFGSMKANDKNSQLLLALKPHFSEKRQAKVDRAISMMRLFSMLPLIKESGLFEGL